MGGGIRRFRNHSVAGTVRWPITLAPGADNLIWGLGGRYMYGVVI